VKRVGLLTHELDTQGLHCFESATCEQVHYARGLVSLFENQEAASAFFRRVIDDNPASDLSASSRLWIQLIEDQNFAHGRQHTLVQLMAQFVRDWMAGELAGHSKQKQAGELPAQQATAGDSSQVVKALQKQVRERDRRIAVLQSQMEDLKLIDQDLEKRKRLPRLPGSLP
jgi:hypothetical protein